MSLHLLAACSKASWPSGALSWLYGPRTFSGRSLTCATGSLPSRHRRIRRLLRRAEGLRPNSYGYARLTFRYKTCYLHRLVMEILLGRMLRRDEHVHHLDGTKVNNRPSNLQLLSASAHNSQTHRRYPLVRFCHWCGNPFLRHHNGDGEQRFCSRRCGGRGAWLRRPRRPIIR